MIYIYVKQIHIWCVGISVCGFSARFIYLMLGGQLGRYVWVKWLPHVVDTLLLISALILIGMIHQYPFVDNWLSAKVLGLFCYIILGKITLQRSLTRPLRVLFFCGALCVVLWIISVALSKNSLGFLDESARLTLYTRLCVY